MLNLAIYRFITTVYKDKVSGSDSAQIPAGATLELHRIGANLTASLSLAPDTDSDSIAVDDPGGIQAGDTVQVSSGGGLHTPAAALYVEAVNGDGTLSLANTSTHTASGSAGDRLVVTSGPLTVYPTQAATGSGSTSFYTDATGVAQCYTHAKRFDVIITISGLATRVIPDSQGQPVNSRSSWVSAADFADLGIAIAQVPAGGTLFIPAGDYTVPSGGLVVSKSITVQGEIGTRLFSSSVAADQPVIKITPGGSLLAGVVLRDLALLNSSRPSTALAYNYGIQCDVPSDGSKVTNLTIERVNIVNMGDDGIHLHALGASDSFFVFVALREVQCIAGKARGLYASYANLLNCYGCYFNGNELDGVRADACEIAFFGCAFENNCTSNATTGSFTVDPTFDGQAYIRTCAISRFDACHFENFTGSGHPRNKRAIMIENSSCSVVSGCSFYAGASVDTSSAERGIFCTWGAGFSTPAPGSTACVILPNTFLNCNVPVEIDAGSGAAQDCVVFPQQITNTSSSDPIGTVKLPTTLSDSGITSLGGRKLGTRQVGSPPTTVTVPLNAGIFVPPRVNTVGTGGDPLPDLATGDAGYLLFDITNKTLRVWEGTRWLSVNTT